MSVVGNAPLTLQLVESAAQVGRYGGRYRAHPRDLCRRGVFTLPSTLTLATANQQYSRTLRIRFDLSRRAFHGGRRHM